MLRSRLIAIGFGLLFSFISFGIQAQETTTTVVEKHVVISPPPVATCSSVPGHWDGDIWVDTHDVCKYENRSEGAAWVNSYWSCTVATLDGTCTTWAFVPGHWVKTLE